MCSQIKIFFKNLKKNRLFQALNQQSHESKSQITTDRPGSRPGSSFRAFGPENRCEVGTGCDRRLRYNKQQTNKKSFINFIYNFFTVIKYRSLI